MKLNLGAGPFPLAGFINSDIVLGPNADVIFDVEQPFPFRDNAFDEIRSNNLLMYIAPKCVIPLMNEIWRVLQVGGRAVFRTPAVPNFEAFCAPGTQSYWNEASFKYFIQGHWRCTWIQAHQGFLGRFAPVELRTLHTRNRENEEGSHVFAVLEKLP